MQIQRKIQQQGPINDDPSRLQYQHAIDNEPKEAQQHNKYNCFFIPSYFPLFFPLIIILFCCTNFYPIIIKISGIQIWVQKGKFLMTR